MEEVSQNCPPKKKRSKCQHAPPPPSEITNFSPPRNIQKMKGANTATRSEMTFEDPIQKISSIGERGGGGGGVVWIKNGMALYCFSVIKIVS